MFAVGHDDPAARGQMTGDIVDALRAALGASAVVTSGSDLEGYLDRHDQGRGGVICAVRPRSSDEVSRVLGECHRRGIKVIAQGGRTGLAGGAFPSAGDRVVLLSLERMRAVRAVDPIGNFMVVEAGCPLAVAREAARSAGRTLGLDHGAAGTSQIGGNLATNAGGNNVIRYGMARDQVLAVEAVLADGAMVGDLRALRKSNAGYDLKSLLIGSEGTLAVVTAATLKLWPAPVATATVFLGVPSAAAVLDLLALARSIVGEQITAFELMSRSAVAFAAGCADEPTIAGIDAPYCALIECEATSRFTDLAAAVDALLSEAMEQAIVVDGTVAASEAQRAAMWRIREGIPNAFLETPVPFVKTDTAVPVSAVGTFVAEIERRVHEVPDADAPIFFGHVGDGNIHVNFVPRDPARCERFRAAMPAAYRMVEDIALALGGTVSAEHGIGQTKREALERMKSGRELALMRAVRAAFDPAAILNPDKILFSASRDPAGPRGHTAREN